MTGELLLLLIGTGLILAGALAGGSRAGAIGLARVGAVPRIAVGGAGLLCVVAAVIVMTSDDSGAPRGPLRVALSDELGPAQVSEQIRVFIDGQDKGVIRIDEQSPKARLTLTVPKPGRYDYRLETTRQLKGKKPVHVSSKGDVAIDGSSHLAVYSDDTGQTYLVAVR
jgi:hypothetical protein